MKPLGNLVLVKPHPPEEKTRGGIIIPETAKKKTGRATVVAVSIDREMPVKPGFEVLMEPGAGSEVIFNDVPHLIVNLDNLLAITYEPTDNDTKTGE